MTPHEVLIPFRDGVRAQPDAVRATVGRTADWLAERASAPRPDGVLLAGIGASHAVLAAPVRELRRGGVPAFRSTGDDLPPGSPVPADLTVAVSQSGRSPETLDAATRGPRSLAVVNQPASPLASATDDVLFLGGLVDSGMSSVAVAATAVALGMLVEQRVHGAVSAVWERLPDALHAVLEEGATARTVAAFAARAAGLGCVDVVGRAASAGAAEQGALLLREGPKVPSLGATTRTYLHGMTDAVGRVAHVLVGGGREAALGAQLAEHDVPVLLVTDEDVVVPAGVGAVRLPTLPPLAAVVTEVAVLQLLALELGSVLGTDVDAGVLTRVDTKVTTDVVGGADR
ncbi:MAG: sugar isomerase [Micrococcales bacterium]|nr:sugar isomerase [Micrococcales bacterium]